jgi:hypothetical protein
VSPLELVGVVALAIAALWFVVYTISGAYESRRSSEQIRKLWDRFHELRR